MDAFAARGPTLTLRYPEPRDAAALFALAGDPEVGRWFAWRYADEEAARAWVDGRSAARAAGAWLEWVVEHREHGVAGITSLLEPSLRDRRALVGSWLGRPFRGSGVNAEAKALVARLAFDGCRLERLGAYASTDTVRSRRALEKAGFVHEGTLRAFHRHGERVHDVDVFGLLRSDWERGPLAGVPVELSGAPPAAFSA